MIWKSRDGMKLPQSLKYTFVALGPCSHSHAIPFWGTPGWLNIILGLACFPSSTRRLPVCNMVYPALSEDGSCVDTAVESSSSVLQGASGVVPSLTMEDTFWADSRNCKRSHCTKESKSQFFHREAAAMTPLS